jgi:Single-strand binding protein family
LTTSLDDSADLAAIRAGHKARPAEQPATNREGAVTMLQTTVTLEGNIAADIELTYTPSGKPVVRFPVLVNRRRKDPDTGQWRGADPARLRRVRSPG